MQKHKEARSNAPIPVLLLVTEGGDEVELSESLSSWAKCLFRAFALFDRPMR
jgi:hypothetical protein